MFDPVVFSQETGKNHSSAEVLLKIGSKIRLSSGAEIGGSIWDALRASRMPQDGYKGLGMGIALRELRGACAASCA